MAKKARPGSAKTGKKSGTGSSVSAYPEAAASPGRQPAEYHEGQRVELLILGQTDIGYNALINDSLEGLLYSNEVFQPLKKGQRTGGFIKKIRDDGKIDLCLHKPGPETADDLSEKIMDMLKAQGGCIAVNDKSPPEVIYRLFGTSKKTFKKAVAALYRKRLILMEDAGIRLAGREYKDPLHGITLEMILTRLVELHGWAALGRMIRIKCFTNEPSIKSSLQFLRKTPWARKKVEALYLRGINETGE